MKSTFEIEQTIQHAIGILQKTLHISALCLDESLIRDLAYRGRSAGEIARTLVLAQADTTRMVTH